MTIELFPKEKNFYAPWFEEYKTDEPSKKAKDSETNDLQTSDEENASEPDEDNT